MTAGRASIVGRDRRISRLRTVILPVLGLLALWEFGVDLAGIPAYVLPRPSLIGARFIATWQLQVAHVGITAFTTVVGLALAIVTGVALALLVTYIRPLEAIVVPALAAFNGIPKVAIAPLFVIWFGLGTEPKILLAFLMGLFPVVVGAITGLVEIDPDVIALARLSGGTERRIFRKVRLMNALPYLADAVKVAFPLALVGSVVGEFIGGNQGVGYLILSAQFNLDTPLVFACLLSITIFTTLGTGAVILFEEIFLGWRPSKRRS